MIGGIKTADTVHNDVEAEERAHRVIFRDGV